MLCTVNADADRVAMHAVRRELLLAQGERLGLPIHVVELPWPCPNAEYERLMSEAIEAAVADGVTRMIFGDLFLADIRAYREQMLEPTGIAPVFPLWAEPTDRLATEMLDSGVRAVLTCVDPAAAGARVRGPRLRRGAARRPAVDRRPVRRERRVPHVRVGRARLLVTHPGRARRGRHPRRLRLRRRHSRPHPLTPSGFGVGKGTSEGPQRRQNGKRSVDLSGRRRTSSGRGWRSGHPGRRARREYPARRACRRRPRRCGRPAPQSTAGGPPPRRCGCR